MDTILPCRPGRLKTGSLRAYVVATKAASMDAAVAAAHRSTLTRLLPAQQGLIDTAYQAALATHAAYERVAEG